jgi:hypothetical protein
LGSPSSPDIIRCVDFFLSLLTLGRPWPWPLHESDALHSLIRPRFFLRHHTPRCQSYVRSISETNMLWDERTESLVRVGLTTRQWILQELERRTFSNSTKRIFMMIKDLMRTDSTRTGFITIKSRKSGRVPRILSAITPPDESCVTVFSPKFLGTRNNRLGLQVSSLACLFAEDRMSNIVL